MSRLHQRAPSAHAPWPGPTIDDEGRARPCVQTGRTPLTTGLGFLVLFSCATTALPLLAVGGVLWAAGARRPSTPH